MYSAFDSKPNPILKINVNFLIHKGVTKNFLQRKSRFDYLLSNFYSLVLCARLDHLFFILRWVLATNFSRSIR